MLSSRRLLGTVILLLVGSPLVAEIQFEIHPADPTLQTQLALGVWGVGNCPSLEGPYFGIVPGELVVVVRTNCPILAPPPEPFLRWLPIGPLSVGKWRFLIEDDLGTVIESLDVSIRHPDFRLDAIPTSPTEDDEVELRIHGVGSCVFAQEPIFDDRKIQVTVEEYGICDPPPVFGPYELPVELGGLAVGEWEVELYNQDAISNRLVSTLDLEIFPSGTCVAGQESLCLQDDRFRVEAEWDLADGSGGRAEALGVSSDTGLYWFFDSANIELMVKVLDGCDPFGTYWVFAAGVTNVGVTLSVTDMLTSEVRIYETLPGEVFQPILDTAAFATCEAQ